MDETFESFFRERVKERGLSIKKLSEITGIASNHLENMVRGNFEDMPSAPYFHGYLVRLAPLLSFDAEEWWDRIKKEGLIKNSGPADALPRNRFVKESHARMVGIVIVIVIVIIYLAIQLPRIWGKPTLTLTMPSPNPFTTQSSTITLQGTVQDADSLYLTGLDGSNSEEITIAPDGSWQKNVLLQQGVNTFQVSAKKFLGGETDVVEQVIYTPTAPTSAPTASSSNSNASASQQIPAGVPTSTSF